MRSNYKKIGDCIQQVKVKNTSGEFDKLLGINIDKFFMPSVANVVGTDLTRYKVVAKNQFACNRMHVGRDYRIPIALSQSSIPFIVSPAYTVFEITDSIGLLPEYMMMWFSRPEFDRECWFHTDADVRGGLPWGLFCDIELPIPSIDKQREFVAEYNTVVNRIKLKEQLNQKLEEIAQTLYKHWFVDFEFPNEEGKPYKSSGGEMVFNEELEKEIPDGWKVENFETIMSITSGKTPNKKSNKKSLQNQVPIYGAGGIMGYTDSVLFNELILSIGRVGTHGVVQRIDFPCWPSDNTLILKSLKYEYTYQILLNINYDELNRGGVQGLITQSDIKALKILVPPDDKLEYLERSNSLLMGLQKLKNEELIKLMELKMIILAKMTKVELEKEIV